MAAPSCACRPFRRSGFASFLPSVDPSRPILMMMKVPLPISVTRWQNLMPSCARVEGVGAQSKERKASNFAAQCSGAIVQKPEGPNTCNLATMLPIIPNGKNSGLSLHPPHRGGRGGRFFNNSIIISATDNDDDTSREKEGNHII